MTETNPFQEQTAESLAAEVAEVNRAAREDQAFIAYLTEGVPNSSPKFDDTDFLDRFKTNLDSFFDLRYGA